MCTWTYCSRFEFNEGRICALSLEWWGVEWLQTCLRVEISTELAQPRGPREVFGANETDKHDISNITGLGYRKIE